MQFMDVSDLDLWLTRVRNLTVVAAVAYPALGVFLAVDEGWRWSFVALFLLSPVAAVLGIRAQREIRGGLSAAAMALAIAPLPLMAAAEAL
ncbi:hypothetical protein [Streptomyces sp. NBC_01465]|uniref:hypothetical protein n=1 Tax=Streptomyces sp. NBC_01465 TaxID=2903878 RepID=UPI002E34BF67|nr:hypothetical protein [Streptomyces sp. NBC_01465]